MSNRIEEAIQKIIFTRKQQDVLLERIIKQSLLLEDAPRKITIRALSKKQFAYAQSQGAEYAFQIVTKDIVAPSSDMISWVQKIIVKSDEDTRDRVAIGPASKFAKGTTAYNLNLNDSKSTVNLPNYIYLVRGPYNENIDNINKSNSEKKQTYTRKYLRKNTDDNKTTKGRFKLSVWIIPLTVYGPLLQYKGHFRGANITKILDSYPKIGDAIVLRENNFSTLLTARLTKIKPGTARDLKDAPESWGISINDTNVSIKPGEAPSEWYKQVMRGMGESTSNIVDVKDLDLLGGKFTGKWDEVFEIPVQGVFTATNETIYDGTFSADGDGKWWLSQGTITFKDGQIQSGQFNRDFALNGFGSYTLSDGTKFKGNFKDGKRVDGTLTTNDQTKVGTWDQNDNFLSGKITYSDGSTVEGTFRDGVAIYYEKNTGGGAPDHWNKKLHFNSDGEIDESKNVYIEYYDNSNNLINYYEGTIKKDTMPLNGTFYASDKTTVQGTYTNGEFKR